MKATERRLRGRRPVELIEEAVHLLRRAPAGAWAQYYAGSLPFVLGALFFWADMSRSPFATQHLATASLGLALLFLWMKFWQAAFAAQLRARAASMPAPRWNLRRCARVLIIQAALQPSAVLLQTASIACILPAPWVYTTYQNITALGDGDGPEVLPVLKKAWRQARLWPGQNLAVLGVLAGFGFFVFLNLVLGCYSLPGLLKSILGIDSVYAQSPQSMLNTTFFAAMLGLAYLCLDPVIKAVYVLRCFYGASLTTGEDLKAELKTFVPGAKMAALLLVSLAGWAGTLGAKAAEATSQPPPAENAQPNGAKLSPPDLDKAIDGVIHQSKYAWRMPRDKVTNDDTTAQGPIGRFFERIGNEIRGWIKAVTDWIGRMLDRLFRRRPTVSSSGGGGGDWMGSLQVFAYLLLVVVVCALVLFIMRAWWKSQRRMAVVPASAIPVTPDLADENTGAEQLPEDGWVKLGRELLERGEFRLALRAFYFASLAQLSARGLITIAKFKSNRDYERELGRRGHSLPEVVTSFGENVVVFDRSWYGLREVGAETVRQFVSNVERMKPI